MMNETAVSVIESLNGVFVASWDELDGYKIIANTLDILNELNVSSSDDYFKILEQYITEEDRTAYQVFVKKIMFKEGIVDSKMSISVRLLHGERSIYHKIDCFFRKDNERIVGLVIVLYPMDSEEIYREILAQTMTNDRSNTVFVAASKELLNKYPDEEFAMIQFDVAKFKAINSVYGESVGDELIQFFINSLRALCTDKQIYVRLTADVFMIMTAYKDDNDILNIVNQLNSNLLNYKGMKYRLVFGVSKITDKTVQLRKYGDQAALARQNLKKDASEYVGIYHEDMSESVLQGKFVEDNVKDAIRNNEFVMYLQPKYSIEKNTIVGAEGLVRWFQKDKGMIPPDKFIPILEMNGLIKEMDAYIWEEACKTLRNWLDKGIDNVPISVNVSRVHLKKSKFIDILNSLIDKYEIPKHLLEIEITESADITDAILEQIDKLKESGFTLLMDDFGSGYSSLNTLKDTKFDVVKIDRGFLQDFIDSDRGQKIVQHTISMTKAIGLDLIAEGVETLDQAKFLAECGCDTAQGYYYAKPMPVKDVEKMLGI